MSVSIKVWFWLVSLNNIIHYFPLTVAIMVNIINLTQGPLCLWSYGSWIYNYLCNQCLSPLTLWVWIPLMRGVLDATWCDKVCQWLAVGWWFSSPSTLVSSTNKTDCHDITEILLKVAFNTINLTQSYSENHHDAILHCIVAFFCRIMEVYKTP